MVRFSIDCTLPFSADDFWRIRDAPSFVKFVVSDGMLKKMTATAPVTDEEGWKSRTQHYCPARVDCPDMVRAIVGDTMFDVTDEQRWHDDLEPNRLHFVIRPSFLSAISNTHGDLSVDPFPTHSSADSAASDDDDDGHASPDQRDAASEDGADSASAARAASPGSDADVEPETDDADTGSTVSDPDAATDPCHEEDTELAIAALPAHQKSIHTVKGVTRVRILTLGWFVERAIVHNLRNFYKEYPGTVMRFRSSLYERFAAGDRSVPIAVVIDRFMAAEAEMIERERAQAAAAEAAVAEKDERKDEEGDPLDDEPELAAHGKKSKGEPFESGELSSVTTPCTPQQSDASSDGLASD